MRHLTELADFVTARATGPDAGVRRDAAHAVRMRVKAAPSGRIRPGTEVYGLLQGLRVVLRGWAALDRDHPDYRDEW